MGPTSRPGYRLYKLSPPSGILLSLPLAIAIGWYAWSAYAQIDRYGRASGEEVPWSVELFQIALHDELTRDLRRISLPGRPESNPLPTFSLSLTRDNLDGLNRQLAGKEARQYVDAFVQKDGTMREVRVRYRGSKPWHWLEPQKSMKVRLDRGDLIDGTRIFNLVNDPTPFGLEEQIILDVSRELGLLTPEYNAVRFLLNNNDMGVYRYAAQPVEGLLRRGRRMPGALYSGDTDIVDSTLHVGSLFFAREGWKQVAKQSGEEGDDFGPLDQLLGAVQGASFLEFAEYARRNIDLPRYAMFDALDVVFGGSEHDYFSNHKFYFDPYRGKFEPIAWSFRGFKHDPEFNYIDHPLLIRLKMTPGYLALRDSTVFSLLSNQASVPNIRTRANQLFEEMAPDLRADPYWDAYKLLPRVSRFHRFMVRPMTASKWLLAARDEIHGYSRRVRYLLDTLERPNISGTAGLVEPVVARLDLRVDGHGAHDLREITVSASCSGPFELRADLNRNGTLDDAIDPVIASGVVGRTTALNSHRNLLAGARLVGRAEPRPKRGRVRVVNESRTFSYLLQCDCPPQEVALILDNRVTGGSSRLALLVERTAYAHKTDTLPPAESVPSFASGQRSAHPWGFRIQPSPEIVRLGPGIVKVPETRVFRPHQEVIIAPDTKIAMGENASLVFHGRVTGEGTVAHPIVVGPAETGAAFGGIVIQGPASAGSRLKQMHIAGGTKAGKIGVDYSSLLNIYDTEDIVIEGVSFYDISGAENVLHATYVRNLRLNEVDIQQAPIDGVDLEFTQGAIRGIHVLGAGDDCLDLMGVNLLVSDSILQSCTNNAVSVGEESEVNAQGLFLSDSETGVLSKNDSHVRISRSLIYGTTTALQTKRRETHYTGDSSIGANDLFAVACKQVIKRARGSRIEVDQIRRALPTNGALAHLARNVLGLPEWSEFGVYANRYGRRPKL